MGMPLHLAIAAGPSVPVRAPLSPQLRCGARLASAAMHVQRQLALRAARPRAESSPSSCTGSGLSSSAALVCASSLAVLAVHDIHLSKGVCSLLSGGQQAPPPNPPCRHPWLGPLSPPTRQDSLCTAYWEHRLSRLGRQAVQEVDTLAPGKPLLPYTGAGAGRHGAGGIGAGPGLKRAVRSGSQPRRGGAGVERRALPWCRLGLACPKPYPTLVQARACPAPPRWCAPARSPCWPLRARARRVRCAARARAPRTHARAGGRAAGGRCRGLSWADCALWVSPTVPAWA